MKKLVFPFLGIWMLGFSGCMKTSDNIVSFTYEPAIVVSDAFSSQPMIETRHGKFLAPELSDESFFDEVLLWTEFQINFDQQPYSNVYTVSNLTYQQIFSAWAYPRAIDDMADGGFNDPIDYVHFDVKRLRKMVFIWFGHKAPKGQTYDYEMSFDPDETYAIRTLYVRAKKTNELTGNNIEVYTCHGFDISMLLYNYENAEADKVSFNIMYYTGTKGEDGKEIYKGYEFNPLTWWILTD